MLLTTMAGLAGNVSGHMSREQAGIDVVTPAGGGADDDGDLPAFVELSNGILSAWGINRHGSDGNDACKAAPHRFLRRMRSAWQAGRIARRYEGDDTPRKAGCGDGK
jgi:hypothetical protein